MRPVTIFALCAVCLAGGYFAGRQGHGGAGADSTEGAPGSGPGKTVASRSGERSERASGGAAENAPWRQSSEKGGKGVLNPALLTAATRDALAPAMEAERTAKWMKLLAAMRPEDAPTIAGLLAAEAAEGRAHPGESTLFWQTWAKMNPRDAWDYARQHYVDGRESGAKTVAKAWAMLDPRTAGDAIMALSNSPMKGQALEGLLHGMAESDPKAAVAFVPTCLPPEFQQEAAVHIGGSIIGQQGPQKAQEWFDSLPSDVPPVFQKESARVLMEALSRSSAAEVAMFAMKRMDQPWAAGPDEQFFTAAMIARSGGSPWDYVSAAVTKYPNAENPLALAQQAANRQDSNSALRWATEHPDAPEAVLAGIALSLQNRGYSQQAAPLMEKIKDPALREKISQGQVISVGGLRREQ